jgi:hypothetical protein
VAFTLLKDRGVPLAQQRSPGGSWSSRPITNLTMTPLRGCLAVN